MYTILSPLIGLTIIGMAVNEIYHFYKEMDWH